MKQRKKELNTHTLRRYLQYYLCDASLSLPMHVLRFYTKWAGAADRIRLFVGYNYKHQLLLSVAIITKKDQMSCPTTHEIIQPYLRRYYEHITS